MTLVHLLHYHAARYNINIQTVHIADVNNVIASCLPQFQQDKFWQLAPVANPIPDTVPVWPVQSFIDASCSAAILM